MAITKEDLNELIKEPDADIDKNSSISSDGKNLLTRLPKDIVDDLKIKKGDKIRWLIKSDTKEIKIELIKKWEK